MYLEGYANNRETSDNFGVAKTQLGLALMDADDECWKSADTYLAGAKLAFESLGQADDIAFCDELALAIAAKSFSLPPLGEGVRRWEVSIPVFLWPKPGPEAKADA